MKNSISDQAFFIESEDYEEDKDSIRGEDDGNDLEFQIIQMITLNIKENLVP